MAARTTAISLGGLVGTSRVLNRTTGISLGSFFTASPFTASGNVTSSVTLRNLFPAQRVKVLNDDGTFTNEWYRAFRFIVDILLGGVNAIPLADIVSAINFAEVGIARIARNTAAIDQMARQNAQVAVAVTQVLRNTGAAGAESIPPVQEYVQNDSSGGE